MGERQNAAKATTRALQLMILIPSLNAHVSPGDFLLASNSSYPNRLVVCQVNEILSCSTVLVTWWLEDELMQNEILCQRMSMLEANYLNVLKCSLKEVTRVMASQTIIDVSSIFSLAFVFHATDFENTWVNCAGMRIVFFTRYYVDNEFNVLLLDPHDHLPFGSGAESYSSRMWFSLIHVKEKITQLLNRKTQQQSCRCATNTFLSLESWSFFCYQLHPYVTPQSYSRSRTNPYQFCDLSLVTRTTDVTHVMLRIANPECMTAARNFFGKTFGIGCRNLPPHKGEGIRRLLQGDIVNFVNVDAPENQQVPLNRFREFIIAQGVELVFESSRRLLSIRVRYSRYNAENDTIQKALGFVREPSQRLPNSPSRRTARCILVGTTFMLNGGLVKVTQCDGRSVIVSNDATGAQEEISVEQARELIKRYILG